MPDLDEWGYVVMLQVDGMGYRRMNTVNEWGETIIVVGGSNETRSLSDSGSGVDEIRQIDIALHDEGRCIA